MTTARYGWNSGANGLALAFVGLLGIPVQVAPCRSRCCRALRRPGIEHTFAPGMVFGILGLALPPLQAMIAAKAAPGAAFHLPGIAFFAASFAKLAGLAVFRATAARPAPQGEIA